MLIVVRLTLKTWINSQKTKNWKILDNLEIFPKPVSKTLKIKKGCAKNQFILGANS